ncbi:NACHT and WD repeat domain-containing protein 2-like isoform X2 [Ptychodera flava]
MFEMILRANKGKRLSTADEVSEEVSHHTLLTQQHGISEMVGMEELKKKVLSYFSSHSPVDKFDKNKPIIIYSRPGCGLTTFMANLVKQMRSSTSSAVVVVRYLATSPHSETSLGILRSLSLQISRVYGSNIAENLTYDLYTLCNVFQSCLKLAQRGKPLWIFLDSLHKLDTISLDNIMLWLQHGFPNRNIRLVISAVRSPKLQYLLKFFIPERNFLEMPPLRVEEIKSIFHTWLRDTGRSLTSEQESKVNEVLEKRQEPLFLRCLFHECCRWTFFDDLKTLPCEDVTSLLTRAIDMHAGNIVASRALSYLSASKYGLSDNEVVDLLLSDDTLKKQPREKNDIRWPTGLWVELRNALDPYIHDTSLGDGTITWQWSHDIFREKARERFLDSEEAYIAIYTHLARYFDGTLGRRSALHYLKNPHQDPGINRQPIILTPESNDGDTTARRIIYNQRTLIELSWALMESRDWQALEELLCDFTFIQAMCATGQVDVLKTLLAKASNMASDNDFDPTTLLEFKYLICRDGHILRREPALLTQQAANYPVDSAPCRWVEQITDSKNKTKPNSNQPWLKLLNKEKIHNSEKSQIRAVHLNMRCAPATKICLSPCGQKLASIGQEKGKSIIKCISTNSGNQYFTYGVEKDNIKSLSFSRDGTRIAIGTGGSVLRLLDSKRGRVLKELKDDTPIIQGTCVDHVTFSGDDRLLVAAYNSAKRTGCRALYVWNLQSERSEHLYSSEAEEGCYPHYGNINSLATSPNSEILASVCDQNVLRIWDLKSNQCLCGVNCDGAVLETQSNVDKSVGCFNTLTFNSNSTKLAVTCCKGLVRVYCVMESQMGQLVATLHHSSTLRLLGAHYHHRLENVLFTCCEKGVVKMWNVNSIELLATTSTPSGEVVKDFSCSCQAPLVCVLMDRGAAHLWSVSVEDQIPMSSDPVTHVSFSPNGKLIAVVHEMSNVLKIYNSDVTEALQSLKLQVTVPCDCTFSSNGDSLIVAGRSGAQVCDVSSGQVSPEITDCFQGPLVSAVFGSNNNTVCFLGKDTNATHTDNGFVRIFHLETRKMVYEFSKMIGDDGSKLKVTEDGSTLACFGLDEFGKESRLLFLDADEGEFIHELNVPQSANMFAVNGGFTFAAICDPEGKAGPVVQLWDVVQQLIVAEYLPYYNGLITSVAMTTDARYLLCAGKDAVHVCQIFLHDDLNGRKQMLKKSAVRRQWTADPGSQVSGKQPCLRKRYKESGSNAQQNFLGEIADVGLFFTPTRTNTTVTGTRPASVGPRLRFVVGDDDGNSHALELVT